MANTGVLPFVRGVDFTNNNFKVCSIILTKTKTVINNYLIVFLEISGSICQIISLNVILYYLVSVS